MKFISSSALFLLYVLVRCAYSRTGWCYYSQANVQSMSAWTTYSYQQSYGCWLFRCHRTVYAGRYVTRYETRYSLTERCCSGYQLIGGQCSPICHNCDSNHQCIAPNTCVCPPGWTGTDCSEAICQNCDSNHQCIAPNTCVCPPGWTGTNCSEDINECENGTSCEQNCINNNGSYTCTCSDEYTLASDSHRCLGPPQNVSLNATASTTIDISWNPPIADSQDGIVLNYSISCFSLGWNGSITHSKQYNHYQWNHLVPFTNYTCCVTAQTTNGLSNSTCDTEQTPEDIPLDSPQNVSLVNVSASALRLGWSSPDTPNGIITVYNIYVTYDNGSIENMTVNGSENSYLIGGLSPHQLVYVSISASTIAGEGPSTSRLEQRTGQAIPLGVTTFVVRSLSPYQISMSWERPDVTNGILTGYEVTVYNLKQYFSISISLSPSVLNYTISNGIKPHVPYTVGVQAFTHVGGGIIETQTVFSQEGVPRKAPQIMYVSREDATTIYLNWTLLTLDELRGFLEYYSIVYHPLEGYSCEYIDIGGGESLSVEADSASISGLDPTVEYCVGIAATTAVGVGSYNKTLLPLYKNFLFQVHFSGVYSCLEWVHDDSQRKVSDFVDTLSKQLSSTCKCHLSNDYIGDTRILCSEESQNTVVLQGRIIGTKDKNVLQLENDLRKWVTTAPHVVVQGVQLKTQINCSVQLSELGDSKCITANGTDPKYSPNEENSFPFYYIIVGVVIAVVLVGLSVLLVCCFLKQQKKVKKFPIQLDTIPSMIYSENTAYLTPNKASVEEYEMPGTKDFKENIYDTIICN